MDKINTRPVYPSELPEIDKKIAKTVYKKGFYLVFKTNFLGGFPPLQLPGIVNTRHDNDIQVVLRDESNVYLADAVCHYGSYGSDAGLWEVACVHPPKRWGDAVKGWLTWKEVEKIFDMEIDKKLMGDFKESIKKKK